MIHSDDNDNNDNDNDNDGDDDDNDALNVFIELLKCMLVEQVSAT